MCFLFFPNTFHLNNYQQPETDVFPLTPRYIILNKQRQKTFAAINGPQILIFTDYCFRIILPHPITSTDCAPAVYYFQFCIILFYLIGFTFIRNIHTPFFHYMVRENNKEQLHQLAKSLITNERRTFVGRFRSLDLIILAC